MAGICCEVVGEGETPTPIERSSRPTRRRRMDLVPLKYIADMPEKRPKLDLCSALTEPRKWKNAVENCESSRDKHEEKKIKESKKDKDLPENQSTVSLSNPTATEFESEVVQDCPKFGVSSVCGRRRDMEDAVSVHPSFDNQKGFHFFGVYDGHGCSHVITRSVQ